MLNLFKKKQRSQQEIKDQSDSARAILQSDVFTEAVARIQEDLIIQFHNADLTDADVVMQIQADRKAFDKLIVNLATIAKEAELLDQ